VLPHSNLNNCNWASSFVAPHCCDNRTRRYDFTGVIFLCHVSIPVFIKCYMYGTKVDVIEKEDELHEKLTAE